MHVVTPSRENCPGDCQVRDKVVLTCLNRFNIVLGLGKTSMSLDQGPSPPYSTAPALGRKPRHAGATLPPDPFGVSRQVLPVRNPPPHPNGYSGRSLTSNS